MKTLKLPLDNADMLDENEALGVDSVDAVVLADAIERDFGVVIETVSQGRRAFSSLSGLAAFLEEAGGALKEERPVDEAPAVADRRYTITPVCRANAHEVAVLFRAIYGEEFPVKYVYHGDQVMREIDEGRLAASLALDEKGAAAGYVSAFKPAPNRRLWEGGNLLVLPAHGEGDLAWMLFNHYLRPGSLPGGEADGVFGEAVCHHYYTQFNCAKAGFADCALALDQLDSASFREHRPDTERVACLLQFFEHSVPPAPIYLPDCYATVLRKLCAPLRPRTFLSAKAPLPDSGETVHHDDFFEAAGTWRVSVASLGGGWEPMLDELLREAAGRNVTSLQVVLSTSLPCTGAAAESMRQRGFFLGGIFPRWFGSDGILMQKVLGKEPDYDGIKLYSSVARELLAFIREDREVVARRGKG
ncbi:MAG TPA: acyl carrier protein [Desulfuromonadaceae bacterium]